MRKIYIDTCLLISYFHQGDTQNQHQLSVEFFNRINDMNEIELCCSHFTITEFTCAYMNIPNITDSETYQIANTLLLTNKIDRTYPFTLLESKGNQKKYSFEDFFLDVQIVLLNTTPRPGLADAIHATIMKNNSIKEIVTFDVSDFENIENIEASRPEELNL